jgi:hypothetical protein
MALATTGRAQNLVDLRWEPALQYARVGDIVEIQLVATSDGVTGQPFAALDAILDWDPDVLEFIEHDDTGAGYAWYVSGFLLDPDGINGDVSDGESLFTALVQPSTPAEAPLPPGLVVTTMRFEVLAETSGTELRFEPSAGVYGTTRVLDYYEPGLEITGDTTSVATVVVVPEPQTTCFGDGTSAPCGCGNELPSTPGGCANGLGFGAVLSASGAADTANDTLVLTADFVTAQPGLMFQGENSINGGPGVTFGDGIRCCGTGVLRLEVIFGQHPQPTSVSTTVTISQHPGQDLGAMPGTTFCYQYWYRDPTGTPCGSTFNFSNAVRIAWT